MTSFNFIICSNSFEDWLPDERREVVLDFFVTCWDFSLKFPLRWRNLMSGYDVQFQDMARLLLISSCSLPFLCCGLERLPKMPCTDAHVHRYTWIHTHSCISEEQWINHDSVGNIVWQCFYLNYNLLNRGFLSSSSENECTKNWLVLVFLWLSLILTVQILRWQEQY